MDRLQSSSSSVFPVGFLMSIASAFADLVPKTPGRAMRQRIGTLSLSRQIIRPLPSSPESESSPEPPASPVAPSPDVDTAQLSPEEFVPMPSPPSTSPVAEVTELDLESEHVSSEEEPPKPALPKPVKKAKIVPKKQKPALKKATKKAPKIGAKKKTTTVRFNQVDDELVPGDTPLIQKRPSRSRRAPIKFWAGESVSQVIDGDEELLVYKDTVDWETPGPKPVGAGGRKRKSAPKRTSEPKRKKKVRRKKRDAIIFENDTIFVPNEQVEHQEVVGSTGLVANEFIPNDRGLDFGMLTVDRGGRKPWEWTTAGYCEVFHVISGLLEVSLRDSTDGDIVSFYVEERDSFLIPPSTQYKIEAEESTELVFVVHACPSSSRSLVP